MKRSEKNAPSKKTASILTVVIITVCIIALLTLSVVAYLNSFNQALLLENSGYLSEITDQITTNMRISITDLQKALETAGLAFPDAQSAWSSDAYLNSIQDKFGFEFVGVAGKNGVLSCTLESENGSILGESYYRQAMRGESTVTHIPVKIFSDSVISGLLFTVPVYGSEAAGDTPTAALLAMLDIQKLSENFQFSGFGGQGSTYLVDGDGNIILQTKNTSYSNFYQALGNADSRGGFTVEQLLENLRAQKSGSASYSYFGVEKFIHYQPLGIENWSLISTINQDVITERSRHLTRQLTFVGILIVILFPLLLVFAASALQSSRSSRQAAQAKTAFLANMSHEIRTPMNAIVGISELLLRESITPKQRNYVLSIVSAGNGLLTIINDILDLSKIEAGKFSIVEEEYEVESLLYDITTITTVKIGDKPVDFLIDIDPSLPKAVIGDMIRVKQVLLNVIGNAVKFTRSGSIHVAISAALDGDFLTLTIPVTDTGCGIRKQDLHRLFDNFSQLDTHKNHTLEGTGLGLAITRHLCEMMGGSIAVQSEYGSGSTFTITLRQRAVTSDCIMPPVPAQDVRLLLFTDSETLRNYFLSCLAHMKLTCTTCATESELDTQLDTGAYTHVLLPSQALRALSRRGVACKGVQCIVLLQPSEQAQPDEYTSSVLIPLFALQMPAVLNHTQERVPFMRRSGINVVAITPMPFVHILMVDDNEVNLQVANGLMEPYHMEVHCALSGQSALTMLQQTDYDLIFMDHMMPCMDGVETVQYIRALPEPQKCNVPVIALTANVTQDARALFDQSGFQDFLAKPIETVKLNAILKKWLKDLNDTRAAENPQAAEAFALAFKNKEPQSLANQVSEEFASGVHVDFGAGVARMGSLATYCGILDTYCRSAREKLDSLPKLLHRDLERFTIEIHALKGASGGVCAELVARVAAQLEALSLENREAEIASELPAFFKLLEATLTDIEAFLAKSRVAESETALSPFPQKQMRGALSPALRLAVRTAFLNFDTQELKQLFEQQQAFAFEEREATLMQKLKGCYEAYDFDEPIALLNQYEAALSKEGTT